MYTAPNLRRTYERGEGGKEGVGRRREKRRGAPNLRRTCEMGEEGEGEGTRR
jgi:hypothetical protein